MKEEITATINFYDYREDEEGNTWDIEFDAEFVKGKLISLKLAKAEIVSTAEENQAREIKWQEHWAAIERHPWNRTKKILNKITFNRWTRFWSKVSKLLYKLQQKISALQLWIIKTLA